VVSEDKDHELAQGDTIEELRSELEKLRFHMTPDGSAWPGAYRVYDQQPTEGNLDVVIGEIDMNAAGVGPLRKVR
jgi:hypothetical protein